MENNSGIYRITNPEGKSYIGESSNLKYRINQYKRLDRCVQRQKKLCNSLIKYGFKNHVIEIIDYCAISELLEKEFYYQKLYNTVQDGLNMKYTHLKVKYNHSPEIAKKISESNKGRACYEETKLKIGSSNKGKRYKQQNVHVKTNQHIENISISRSKIILNTQTGVFYYGTKKAAFAFNLKTGTLRHYLDGSRKNKTDLIWV